MTRLSKTETPPPCAWQRMLSGRRLDLLDPSPLDIEVEDIAQGLSRVARWNGQTEGDWAYSVAQHSLLVEAIVRELRPGYAERWLLAALLHDAAEYVLGDLITPFKLAVGADYKKLETRLGEAIRIRFGIPANLPQYVADTIERADKASAYFEATRLAGFGEREARTFFGRPRGIALPTIRPVPPDAAKEAFVARHAKLLARMT
ncbi:MAG: hydrolase [Rhodospirillales bacterium]|nr:hydrolase [Rhodospirillales bacterium]